MAAAGDGAADHGRPARLAEAGLQDAVPQRRRLPPPRRPLLRDRLAPPRLTDRDRLPPPRLTDRERDALPRLTDRERDPPPVRTDRERLAPLDHDLLLHVVRRRGRDAPELQPPNNERRRGTPHPPVRPHP
jgi:hypothetical protein